MRTAVFLTAVAVILIAPLSAAAAEEPANAGAAPLFVLCGAGQSEFGQSPEGVVAVALPWQYQDDSRFVETPRAKVHPHCTLEQIEECNNYCAQMGCMGQCILNCRCAC